MAQSSISACHVSLINTSSYHYMWPNHRVTHVTNVGAFLSISKMILVHNAHLNDHFGDRRWTYTPDNKYCLVNLDVDRLDVFYLRNYFKELDYETMKEVWWQVPGMSLEVGLRRLDSNNELK
ncbi:hypothetical protein Ahy_A03g016555 [Arachis hypogaea]|uniref:PB1-like domain-containing protein n=1 Tax=Arachis hypogaea TaxID=3818 RepID=A0A445E3N9_ARAHY|nr:hypothetical protein Ahy_A03g016555 [Arachis hypogaea]